MLLDTEHGSEMCNSGYGEPFLPPPTCTYPSSPEKCTEPGVAQGCAMSIFTGHIGTVTFLML